MKENKQSKTKNKIIIIIVAAVLIVAVVLGIIFILNFSNRKEQKIYEEKMTTYGFAKLYNNQSANSSENVTRSEMLKIVIAALLNTDDITDIAQTPTDTYGNAIWAEYAKNMNIVEQAYVTAENEASNASYIDAIMAISKAKRVLLDEEYGKAKDVVIKDMEEYSDSEQKAIRDLIANGIIDNEKEKLKATKDITKAQFNKLISKTFEKYNVTYGTIEQDENNLPANKDSYPYILSEVPKEIYEATFVKNDAEKFQTPTQAYVDLKSRYESIKSNIEAYYNILLNIDYETINEEKFKTDLSVLSVGIIDDEQIKSYVEYVKTNKIKLEGKATVQLPIVYYDGLYYRARTKIELTVKNSDTDKNLLFQDTGNIKYDGKAFSCYADVRLGSVFNNDNLYVSQAPLVNILLKDKNYGISNLESEGK